MRDWRERLRELPLGARRALLKELARLASEGGEDIDCEATEASWEELEDFLAGLPPGGSRPGEDRRGGRRRVVITGMGAVTPLALTAEETWKKLVAGESGIGYITRFDASAYPCRIAGEVKGFDPAQYMDAKSARRMSYFSQFALASAKMALEDACLAIEPEEAQRVGILMGVAAGSILDSQESCRRLLEKGGRSISPFFLLTMIPNMASFHIAHALGIRGYNSTVATACATGAQAIGEAAAVIRRGEAEVMLAGGSEGGLCELALAGFIAMGALTTFAGDPREASRPFDKTRDGFVGAEGCAVLVLERLERALARRASIYAEVLGYCAASDGYHMAAPEPTAEGAVQVIRGALLDAGLRPEEVDYINAHGTSTPLNDAVETLAVKKALGEEHARRVPISSTKSMIGHPISAAGAIEAMVCALTIRDSLIHPTINYRTPDPECDLDYVPNLAREASVEVALSNSFGLGSQNVSLVLGKFRG